MRHLLSPDDWSYAANTLFGVVLNHLGLRNTVGLAAVAGRNAPALKRASPTLTRALEWTSDRWESFYSAFFALFNGSDSPHWSAGLGVPLLRTPTLARKAHLDVAAVAKDQSECLNKFLVAVHV